MSMNFLTDHTAEFLRLKYAVLNAIHKDPNCTFIRIKDVRTFTPHKVTTNNQSLSFGMSNNRLQLLAENMGFNLTFENGNFENENLLIKWDSTTQFDSSLLRIDPRYNLLEYKKKLDLIS